MFWSTIDINKLIRLLSPTFLRKQTTLAFLDALMSPMQDIVDATLYKMQHDGRKIYLEKVLNEAFEIDGYSDQDHENTKKIYITDLPLEEKIFIHQNDEDEVIFLEDEDQFDNDIYLESEADLTYSFIIWMPSNIPFIEFNLRALVDAYRYAGKLYKIEIYQI